MTLKNSGGDKSLYVYTSLIFLVAIVMIIVSFFAQTHLDSSKVVEPDEEKVSLSDKAARVSEENMQLVELNQNLKATNQALTDENAALNETVASLTKEKNNYEALMQVYDNLYDGNKSEARTLLEGIYTEDLSDLQKDFFDILVKKSQ